jgi:ribonuclease HI
MHFKRECWLSLGKLKKLPLGSNNDAKFNALYELLKMCNPMKLKSIDIEVDYLICINAIKNHKTQNWKFKKMDRCNMPHQRKNGRFHFKAYLQKIKISRKFSCKSQY